MSSVKSAALLVAFAALQPLSEAETAKCRRETGETVLAAGATTTLRNALLLRGVGDRCGKCGACPDMIG